MQAIIESTSFLKLSEQQHALLVVWIYIHCFIACGMSLWIVYEGRIPREVPGFDPGPGSRSFQETLDKYPWAAARKGIIEFHFSTGAQLPSVLFVLVMVVGLIPIAYIYADSVVCINRGMPHASAATRR